MDLLPPLLQIQPYAGRDLNLRRELDADEGGLEVWGVAGPRKGSFADFWMLVAIDRLVKNLKKQILAAGMHNVYISLIRWSITWTRYRRTSTR